MEKDIQKMKTLLAILQIIPALIEIIVSIEKAFPQAGAGSEKLTLVKTILSETYASITDLWEPLEKIVAAVVAFANKIGAFSK